MLIEYLETNAHNISFPHLLPFITVYLLRFEIKSGKSFSLLVYHKAFCLLLLNISKSHSAITSFLQQNMGVFSHVKQTGSHTWAIM